jgi:hypothetical protein
VVAKRALAETLQQVVARRSQEADVEVMAAHAARQLA